jgi:beta-aspartyl-peptidase (threonine type)
MSQVIPLGLAFTMTAALTWPGRVVDARADDATPKVKWAIVLHGGAGTVPKDAPAEEVAAYRTGLQRALEAGKKILESGGTSLDAVEQTIRVLEDDPLFNAGVGAVFNAEGGHELDASIMDGRTLDGGGVAGVTTVKNPISLARLVMERTGHVLLAGAGAEAFATEMDVPRVENAAFSTERRRAEWQRARQARTKSDTGQAEQTSAQYFGTVGCVALDAAGNIAAGTSTGGRTDKKFGRVGDSPILGAGTYADNETCGVSGTGIGEQFIRHAAAAQIPLLMRHRGWTLRRSAEYVMQERLEKGDGGVVALDRHGEIVWVYTTPGMFRAAADSSGRHAVHIRDEE